MLCPSCKKEDHEHHSQEYLDRLYIVRRCRCICGGMSHNERRQMRIENGEVVGWK